MANVLAVVKANKDKIIKIGLAVIGAAAGVALVVVSKNGQNDSGEITDVSGEPPEPPSAA